MKKYKLKKSSICSVSFENADMFGVTFYKFVELMRDVEKHLNIYYSNIYDGASLAEVFMYVTIGCDSCNTMKGFYLQVFSGLIDTQTDMYIKNRNFKIRFTDYLFDKREVIRQISDSQNETNQIYE
jgi:hypothetical protein